MRKKIITYKNKYGVSVLRYINSIVYIYGTDARKIIIKYVNNDNKIYKKWRNMFNACTGFVRNIV